MKLLSVLTLCFYGLIATKNDATIVSSNDSHGSYTRNTKESSGKKMIEKSKLLSPDDVSDIDKMPKVVRFTTEQREYIATILASMRRVIEQISKLEAEEDRLLGKGRLHWPKDPTKPVLRKFFFEENFRIEGMTLAFERAAENAPWTKAGLAITPRNYPNGVYMMGLSKEAFAGLVLVRARQEDRPNESIVDPIVFYFVQPGANRLTLKVESRKDLADAEDKFPSSFHAFEIAAESDR